MDTLILLETIFKFCIGRTTFYVLSGVPLAIVEDMQHHWHMPQVSLMLGFALSNKREPFPRLDVHPRVSLRHDYDVRLACF